MALSSHTLLVQEQLRLLKAMRAQSDPVLIIRCDDHRAHQMEAGLQEMKHQVSRHPLLRPPAPPPPSTRFRHAQTGLLVLSRTRRCTRRAHLRAMVAHVITPPVHRQYHYSPQTSPLLAVPVRCQCQQARGQVVLGRPVSRVGVCTGTAEATLVPLLQVVAGEWSAHHREV